MFKVLGILLVTFGLPGGLLLLLRAVKIIQSVGWPPVLVKLPLVKPEEEFEVDSSKTFKIWIEGPVRTLIPQGISCQIKNLETGTFEDLSLIQFRMNTVDFEYGKGEVFKVKLKPGRYKIQICGGDIGNAWGNIMGSIIPSKVQQILPRSPIEKWSFVLTESRPKIYFVLGIIGVIICAGLTIAAMVFGIIFMQK